MGSGVTMTKAWHGAGTYPHEWYGALTLNLLEFLDSKVSIYMTIKQPGNVYHFLAFIDIFSALEWMHKASFDSVNK